MDRINAPFQLLVQLVTRDFKRPSGRLSQTFICSLLEAAQVEKQPELVESFLGVRVLIATLRNSVIPRPDLFELL